MAKTEMDMQKAAMKAKSKEATNKVAKAVFGHCAKKMADGGVIQPGYADGVSFLEKAAQPAVTALQGRDAAIAAAERAAVGANTGQPAPVAPVKAPVGLGNGLTADEAQKTYLRLKAQNAAVPVSKEPPTLMERAKAAFGMADGGFADFPRYGAGSPRNPSAFVLGAHMANTGAIPQLASSAAPAAVAGHRTPKAGWAQSYERWGTGSGAHAKSNDARDAALAAGAPSTGMMATGNWQPGRGLGETPTNLGAAGLPGGSNPVPKDGRMVDNMAQFGVQVQPGGWDTARGADIAAQSEWGAGSAAAASTWGAANGAIVPQTGADPSGTEDNVPAMLSEGEAVLPKDTVQAVGKDKIAALIAATHTPVAARGHAKKFGYVDGTEEVKKGMASRFGTGLWDRIKAGSKGFVLGTQNQVPGATPAPAVEAVAPAAAPEPIAKPSYFTPEAKAALSEQNAMDRINRMAHGADQAEGINAANAREAAKKAKQETFFKGQGMPRAAIEGPKPPTFGQTVANVGGKLLRVGAGVAGLMTVAGDAGGGEGDMIRPNDPTNVDARDLRAGTSPTFGVPVSADAKETMAEPGFVRRYLVGDPNTTAQGAAAIRELNDKKTTPERKAQIQAYITGSDGGGQPNPMVKGNIPKVGTDVPNSGSPTPIEDPIAKAQNEFFTKAGVPAADQAKDALQFTTEGRGQYVRGMAGNPVVGWRRGFGGQKVEDPIGQGEPVYKGAGSTLDRQRYQNLGDYGAEGTKVFGRASTPGGKINQFVGAGGAGKVPDSGVDLGIKPGEVEAFVEARRMRHENPTPVYNPRDQAENVFGLTVHRDKAQLQAHQLSTQMSQRERELALENAGAAARYAHEVKLSDHRNQQRTLDTAAAEKRKEETRKLIEDHAGEDKALKADLLTLSQTKEFQGSDGKFYPFSALKQRDRAVALGAMRAARDKWESQRGNFGGKTISLQDLDTTEPSGFVGAMRSFATQPIDSIVHGVVQQTGQPGTARPDIPHSREAAIAQQQDFPAIRQYNSSMRRTPADREAAIKAFVAAGVGTRAEAEHVLSR